MPARLNAESSLAVLVSTTATPKALTSLFRRVPPVQRLVELASIAHGKERDARALCVHAAELRRQRLVDSGVAPDSVASLFDAVGVRHHLEAEVHAEPPEGLRLPRARPMVHPREPRELRVLSEDEIAQRRIVGSRQPAVAAEPQPEPGIDERLVLVEAGNAVQLEALNARSFRNELGRGA